MDLHEKALKSDVLYHGKMLELRLDTVKLPSGKTSTREIINHPGAVGVAAITSQKEIVLVKQYRHACAETLLEIPAGKLEQGEAPLYAAKRELKEETGITGANFKPLGYVYTSPGYSNEIMHLYSCEAESQDELNLDEDEFLEPVNIKIEKALQMIANNEISDAKTQLCILKILGNYPKK